MGRFQTQGEETGVGANKEPRKDIIWELRGKTEQWNVITADWFKEVKENDKRKSLIALERIALGKQQGES